MPESHDAATPEAERLSWVAVLYWAGILVTTVVAEVFVVMRFLHAQHAFRVGTAEGCQDECFGVFFHMLGWGFMLFGWPMLALCGSVIMWYAGQRLGLLIMRR